MSDTTHPRPLRGAVTPAKDKMADIPVGLWQKCPKCRTMLYLKELERNFRVCYNCQHHFPLTTAERITLLADDDRWEEIDSGLLPGNPLDFPDYADKLARSRKKSGQSEGFIFGDVTIGGVAAVLGLANFAFMGGSMGSVYGEKVARALERAAELQRPMVMVCASGGARMQEGIISLMQMAKTAAACERRAAFLRSKSLIADWMASSASTISVEQERTGWRCQRVQGWGGFCTCVKSTYWSSAA